LLLAGENEERGGGEMLRNLSLLVLGLVLAGGAIFLGPAAVDAGSGDVFCSGFQSDNVPHNLIVPGGESCVLGNITIGNDVIVGAGAKLWSFIRFHVGHNIVANGAAQIAIYGGTCPYDWPTVGHDVILTGASANANLICGVQIGHNLVIQNSTGTSSWNVGEAGCGPGYGNVVGNDLIVRDNSGSDFVNVTGNTAGHNLIVKDNTGTTTTVNGNSAGNDAKCSGNTGFTGSANTADHVNTCNSDPV
jgi:hypothetical protein